MTFCDCKNCLHQECCGGPQYGCRPAYTEEHYSNDESHGEYE